MGQQVSLRRKKIFGTEKIAAIGLPWQGNKFVRCNAGDENKFWISGLVCKGRRKDWWTLKNQINTSWFSYKSLVNKSDIYLLHHRSSELVSWYHLHMWPLISVHRHFHSTIMLEDQKPLKIDFNSCPTFYTKLRPSCHQDDQNYAANCYQSYEKYFLWCKWAW